MNNLKANVSAPRPDTNAARPFIDFVDARERLRLRKAAGLTPFSDDPILSTYRFCNVRRGDDRVSLWLKEHVLRPEYYEKGPEAFLLFTALCRHINWPPTIKAIMDAGLWPVKQLDLHELGWFIDKRTRSGEKTWTGAYMIRAEPEWGDDQGGKGAYVTTRVIGGLEGMAPALVTLFKYNPTREEVWRLLQSLYGWGSFMAGQVVDDWGWTPLLSEALDTLVWAPQGPGSLRGFNRVMGRPIKTRVTDQEWRWLIPRWRSEVVGWLGWEYGSLTAMDLQNCLCEFDKYMRVKNNEGRPRALYKPETAY